MTFDERFTWLLSGVVIGLFMSYLTGTLSEIREEVKKVNTFLRENQFRKQDERGAMNSKTVNSLALFLVVLVSLLASVKSQIASNKADDARDQLESVVVCLTKSQATFLDAVNTRTVYTQTQASANKTLQEAQKVFFGILLHRPPYTAMKQEEAAHIYQAALNDFLDAADASAANAKTTKYPKAEDLLDCIKDKKED